MTTKIKYGLMILLILLMVMPALQKALHLVQVKPLSGDFREMPAPRLTWESWLSGQYQSQADAYIEQHTGFRPWLVRLNNQLDYSLFRKANAEGVVIGKEGYLFESDYIREYLGEDYTGRKFVHKNMRHLRFLQEYLKDAYGTDLLLVFEPGKARYYPEYLPSTTATSKQGMTNFKAYKHAADSLGVRYLDLNAFYLSQKGKHKYPLYTRNGIHWSEYGAVLAADTLIRFLEDFRGIDMPEMWVDTIEYAARPRSTDNDVSKTMNLLHEPPMDTMAYPQLAFGDTAGKDRPNVLVVGDSYYWNIFNTRLPRHLFKNEAFWYFYHLVYPDTYSGEKTVAEVHLREETEKQDIILLMVTHRFLFKFDWGFVNDLYRLYAPTSDLDRLHDNKITITKDNHWFTQVIQKARERDVPVGKMLELDALYMLETYKLPVYLSLYGPAHYGKKIRQDEDWLRQVREKAKSRGIAFEEMIAMDAAYMFRKQHPKLYEKYQYIQDVSRRIRSDSIWMKDILRKARHYQMTPEEMIRCDAEWMWEQKANK